MTSFFNSGFNSDFWYVNSYIYRSGNNWIVDDIHFYSNMKAIVEVDQLTSDITSLSSSNDDVFIGYYNGHSYFYLNSTWDFSQHL